MTRPSIIAHTESIKEQKRSGESRECLVCGGETSAARMGLDMCRACSAFYKRAVGKKFYECLSGTNYCKLTKNKKNGDACKKCRQERIESLLSGKGESGPQPMVVDSSPPEDPPAPESDAQQEHVTICEPSCFRPVATSTRSHSAPILDKVRSSYKTMCQIRLTTELLARPTPPHPMLMTEEDCPFEQATAGKSDTVNQILLSTIVGFGRSAFPEFATLSREHQWALTKNFFFRFRMFEASYRADKIFANEPDRLFTGYTYWFTHHYDDKFYSDCPNVIDVEHVKTSMHKFCKGNHNRFRTFMKRLGMTETEFLYITAMLFWRIDGLELPEAVVSIADANRAKILLELHAYFCDERKMENYAARLGELLTAIQTFDMTHATMKANFEFLRLMNVFSDDSFLYRIQREDAPV